MPEETELLALKRIDDTSTRLQKQGNYLEALECMERGLVLRQHFFGVNSDQVWGACKVVGEMCNLLAMTHLQQENFDLVAELLKKAEILTERDLQGKAVTCNNLACYHRRRGKLRNSLKYLEKALRIESKLEGVENAADTHLNACAVLSQLGRHSTALEHAQSALILLQEELIKTFDDHDDNGNVRGGNQTNTTTANNNSDNNNEKEENAVASSEAKTDDDDNDDNVGNDGHNVLDDDPPLKLDRIAVLAIAYHNVGAEQEFLKKKHLSKQSYRKGLEVAQKYLGPDHAMTKTLKSSFVAVKKAIRKTEKR